MRREFEHLEQGLRPQEYDEPQWDVAGAVNDWRNYVTSQLARIWDDFTGEQKLVIAYTLQQQADKETVNGD